MNIDDSVLLSLFMRDNDNRMRVLYSQKVVLTYITNIHIDDDNYFNKQILRNANRLTG